MRDLIIGKNVAYGTGTGITPGTTTEMLLDNSAVFGADGSLLIVLDNGLILKIDENGTPATNIAAIRAVVNAANCQWFKIGVYNAAKEVQWSEPIYRQGQGFCGKAYTAPVKKAVVLGIDSNGDGTTCFPSTLVVGDTVTLSLTKGMTAPPYKPGDKHTYTLRVNAGDTKYTLMDKLYAAINADTKCPYTASGKVTSTGTVGFVITADNYGDDFTTSGAYLNQDGTLYAPFTVNYDGSHSSVLFVKGSGTATELAAIEKEFNSERGDTLKGVGEREWMWTETSKVVSGATYDIYTIKTRQDRRGNIGMDMGVSYKDVLLALPATSNTVPSTDLEEALTALLSNSASSLVTI